MSVVITNYAHLGEDGHVLMSEIGGIPSVAVAQVQPDLTTLDDLTTLYTVPADSMFLLQGVYLFIASSSSVISTASVSIGTSGDSYAVWLPITVLPSIGDGNYVDLGQVTPLTTRRLFQAGEVIKIKTTTAAVATSLSAVALVVGITIS